MVPSAARLAEQHRRAELAQCISGGAFAAAFAECMRLRWLRFPCGRMAHWRSATLLPAVSAWATLQRAGAPLGMMRDRCAQHSRAGTYTRRCSLGCKN